MLSTLSRLFQFLFGEEGKNKVDDAIQKWSSLPPLPVPELCPSRGGRLDPPTTPRTGPRESPVPRELEQRYQCVVHYGTWAMQGRTNPDLVFRTVDTMFGRGRPRKVQEYMPGKLFPEFEKAAGLGSEVVRYLFQAVAPAEHRECCDVFQTLPKTDRVGLLEPTFATHYALGTNSFTGRHADETDVRHGFAGLVALPGDCVISRGAEMEPFVADWTGYRIFLLYMNHQPVRNYGHRILGKLPLRPNDLWHPDQVREREEAGEVTPTPESEPDTDSYDPCYTEPLSPEPETLYEADIQGPAYIPSDLLYADSTRGSSDKSSVSSYLDHGRIMVEGPEFKKRKTEN
ncbi:hypothetical protein DL767_000284 [Monosporascus sp. MG133]|nr:hypothetical protein DL767_000284 [Monosporascus sp. MG133]